MTTAMQQLQLDVSLKLAELEILFERSGVPMSNITLIARDPNNDARSVVLSNEASLTDIKKAFEIVRALYGANDTEPT